MGWLATKDDTTVISRILITALRESNAQDYPAQVEKSFTPEAVATLLDNRRVAVWGSSADGDAPCRSAERWYFPAARAVIADLRRLLRRLGLSHEKTLQACG